MPPPQTQATEHIDHRIEPQTRATKHIRHQRSEISPIRSEIASLMTFGLESSPRRAAATLPLKPPSRYFSSLHFTSFSFSLLHLWVNGFAVVWDSLSLSLSLSLWTVTSFTTLLYNFICPCFDFIRSSWWVCLLVYCEFIWLALVTLVCLVGGGWGHGVVGWDIWIGKVKACKDS